MGESHVEVERWGSAYSKGGGGDSGSQTPHTHNNWGGGDKYEPRFVNVYIVPLM